MMIIKDKIQQLMIGYPTVSDKYNVAGGVLSGSQAVKFGDVVTHSGTTGYFEAVTEALTSAADVAGFVVATNVKLADTFGGSTVSTQPGEAFNLLVNGFIAVELDAGATTAQIKPNAEVEVILASGKLTTSDKASSGTIVALPNVVFTGTWEMQGSKIVAEIYVK